MAETKGTRITRLIAIPTVLTLAVTLVRVTGELKHWPAPWFSSTGGGSGAIIGIVWLPIIFGPYFALKLVSQGNGPRNSAEPLLYAFFGLIAFVLAAAMFERSHLRLNAFMAGSFLLMIAAVFLPFGGWKALGKALLAYAFAARIPVLIVAYFAMRGNGGAGWGTHYDRVGPAFAHLSFAQRYFDVAVIPQLTLWIGWTVVLGAITGGVVYAIVSRGKRTDLAGA